MFRNRAAAVIVILFVLIPTCWSQSPDGREWTDKHFTETLDSLFPLNQQIGVYIAYRSHRDLYTDVPEYWFLIKHQAGLDSYLTARVRVADSASIYDQMTRLHSKNPNDALSEIQKQVRVKESVFTEMNCPAVKSQFVKLQQLRIAMPHFNQIVLHPLIHQIRVRGGTGDYDLEIDDESNNVVSWALETRRALEACETAAQHK